MSFWRRTSRPQGHPLPADPGFESERPRDPVGEAEGVAGERGVPPHNPFKSVQSRVSSVLTVALMIVLAAGLLIWYYSNAIGRNAKAHRAALANEQRRAQGESTLPPLGPFHLPQPMDHDPPNHDTEAHAQASQESTLQRLLGGPPEPPGGAPEIPLASVNPYGTPTPGAPPPKTPAQLALDRRMSGPVLSQGSGDPAASTLGAGAVPNPMSLANLGLPGNPASATPGRADSDPHAPPTLESFLRATATPAVAAQVLPTERYLLPKGAFIDCTLETAISSSLPGMTTCVTATDTFSADGTVVLLERGTKLVGETRGVVQAGSPRLFVLWDEARTPAGIVVPLESPGTDELGRSGLSGTIDWHWWQRFGAAMLVTIIDGAVLAAEDRSNSSSIQINPSGASDVMTETLRSTLSIPPTINKPQGDRIEILVARDVDFRTVYELRAQGAGGE
jgi:type IV secretion system protein VirB10